MYRDPYVEYQPQHPELLGFVPGGRSKKDTEAAKKRLEEQRRLNEACVRSEPSVPDKKPKKPFICMKDCQKKFKKKMEQYEAAVEDHAEWSSSECAEARKQAEKKKGAGKRKKKEYDQAVEKLIRSHEELMPVWMKGKWLDIGDKEQKIKDRILQAQKYPNTVKKLQDAIDAIKDDNGVSGAGVDLLQDAIKKVVEELEDEANKKRDECLHADQKGQDCKSPNGGVKSVKEFLQEM